MNDVRTEVSRRRLSAAILAQLLVRAFGVGTGVLVAAGLARGLGHEEFGQFSFVLTLVLIAETVGDLGLLTTAVRHLAANPERESRVMGALVLARAGTGVLGALAVVVAVFAFDGSTSGRVVGVIVAATLLLTPLSAFRAVGQARLKVGAQNIQLVLQSTLWTVVVVVLAAVGAPITAFGVGFLAVSVVQAVVTWLMFRKLTPVSFDAAMSELRSMLRIAAPIAIGGLFVTSYYRFGGVLLYRFQGPDAVADYAAAARFLDILQVVPATLLTVVLPLLAATWRSGDPEQARRRARLFELSLTAVITAALPLAVGGALISSRLILLVYGDEFGGSAAPLSVLLISFPAICIGYVVVGLALASGRTMLYCGVSAAAALVSVPANLLLIPQFGAMAAAWVTVATEFGVATTLLVVLCRATGVRPPVRSWLGALTATALMAAVVLPLQNTPLVVSVGAGALVYGIGALLFRAVTRADLKALTDRDAKVRL